MSQACVSACVGKFVVQHHQNDPEFSDHTSPRILSEAGGRRLRDVFFEKPHFPLKYGHTKASWKLLETSKIFLKRSLEVSTSLEWPPLCHRCAPSTRPLADTIQMCCSQNSSDCQTANLDLNLEIHHWNKPSSCLERCIEKPNST